MLSAAQVPAAIKAPPPKADCRKPRPLGEPCLAKIQQPAQCPCSTHFPMQRRQKSNTISMARPLLKAVTPEKIA